MLLNAQSSCLIVVDMQEKLLPFIHMHQELIARCSWILEVALILDIPTLVSEQYPKGLGHTHSDFVHFIQKLPKMSKTAFSCAQDEGCLQKILDLNRDQIVLVGIETHVCVLQTALDLKAAGKEVFVVADATESRRMQDKVLAIDRMQFAGVEIISAEMALFEWCKDSQHPQFKTLSDKFLR